MRVAIFLGVFGILLDPQFEAASMVKTMKGSKKSNQSKAFVCVAFF